MKHSVNRGVEVFVNYDRRDEKSLEGLQKLENYNLDIVSFKKEGSAIIDEKRIIKMDFHGHKEVLKLGDKIIILVMIGVKSVVS